MKTLRFEMKTLRFEMQGVFFSADSFDCVSLQLSERVIRDRRTEPDWLIDLRQLKQSKVSTLW